jgi:rhodanese-related sulfurtransferase
MITADVRNYTYLSGGVLLLALSLWFSSSVQLDFQRASAVPEISVRNAATAIAQGAVVIDVRERAVYERGHIAGAISVPLAELKRRAGQYAAMKSREIVVYCGNGSTLGPEGTSALNAAGHSNARNLSGGYSGWKAAGQPVVTGPR